MRKLLSLAATAAIFVMTSCGGGEEVDKNALQSAEERLAEIAQNEADFDPNTDLNGNASKAKADRLAKLYLNFVSSNPHDAHCPEFLFKGSKLYVGIGNNEAALRMLDRLTTDYRDYEQLPEAMLFKGFICEVHMNNYAEATKAYQALVDRFPNHRLANDARASIENMTLSEEELLEKFSKASEEQKPL